MQTPRSNKMEIVPVRKLLLSMSLPIMFSMMIQALYNVVDSIFIARFSEKALSAVSLTFPIQSLLIALGIGTCVGVSAFLSRTLCEKNLEKAQSIMQHGVILAFFSYLISFLVGLFITRQFFTIQTADIEIVTHGIDYMSICLTFSIFMFGQLLFERFLQARGFASLSMISQIVGAVVNIILDPLLIFGLAGFPSLGAQGAAIATVIGQFTGFVTAFLLHQYRNRVLKVTFVNFHFNGVIVKEIYRIGLPAIIMQSIGSVAIFLLNGILLTFSTTATAFFGAYSRLQNFIFMFVYGLMTGLLPIMAYNLGAKQKQRVLDTVRYGMLYMAIIVLVGTAIFQLFPNQLLGFFGASNEMLAIGVPALRVLSSYFVFEGFCLISQTSFQALGRGMASLICSLTRQVIVLLPVAYALSLGGNIDQIWFAYPITGAVSAVVCLLIWRDVYKKNIAPLPNKPLVALS